MRGDAGNQQRLVAGGDEAQPLLAFEGETVLFARLEVGAVKDDLGAVRAHGVHLDRAGAFGHDDDGPHAKQLRGVGHRLAVVAGGGRHHAAAPFFRRHVCHEVDAAAHLESADGLIVLMLDEDGGVEQRVQLRVVMQRGRRQVRCNRTTGKQNILKGGQWFRHDQSSTISLAARLMRR